MGEGDLFCQLVMLTGPKHPGDAPRPNENAFRRWAEAGPRASFSRVSNSGMRRRNEEAEFYEQVVGIRSKRDDRTANSFSDLLFSSRDLKNNFSPLFGVKVDEDFSQRLDPKERKASFYKTIFL